MGNVFNVLLEIELCGVMGWMIGDEGCGIVNILEMVVLIWFDCMIGFVVGMWQVMV